VNLPAVLTDLQVFLGAAGWPCAVVGAVSLHAYGSTRQTNDLDLLTIADARNELVPFLESRGYETLHVSEGYSNHLHPDPALGRVDVVYVDATTCERIFAAARPARIAGVSALVPKPEHLAAMKVHALKNDPSRRFRDLADVQFLAGLPGVDREEIRGYFERAGMKESWDELEASL
jgi:hypothetical protein